jgi:hypothetical protein
MKPDSADAARLPGGHERQPADPPAPVDEASPGLPWLRSWPAVYLFVLGCFAAWVALLVVFGRLFA